MEYYDFTTPVSSDITLTAVWNDTIDPNTPTLQNLYRAGMTGYPQNFYSIGTEFEHKDSANYDNPWVIMHYGNVNVLEESGQTVSKFGAILGLKYLDGTLISVTYDAAQTAATCITKHLEHFDSLLSDNEKQFFAPVVTSIGTHRTFMPTQANMTLGNGAVWDYYSNAATYYDRIINTSLYNNGASNAGYGYYAQWSVQGTALNIYGAVSGVSYMASVSFSTRSISTSSSYSCRPKYCVFMPFLQQEKL